ncbi:MAG: AI-2E family transporter [Kiritimatiellaeota bacterium]|nr:AI-2E family transporter [Kiritimatiellota bacterium]
MPPLSPEWFSPRQRRTVAAGLTVLSAGVVITAVLFVLRVLSGFLLLVKPVLMPLATAAVLALLFRPFFQWLRRWTRHKVLALVLFYILLCVPLLGIAAGVGALVVEQVIGLFNSIPTTLLELDEAVWRNMPRLKKLLEGQGWLEYARGMVANLATLARENARDFAGARAAATASGLLAFGKALLIWAVLPVYLGFFLLGAPMEGDRLEPFLPFLKDKTRASVVYLANQFLDMLVSFFRGQIIIAVIQGVLFGIGFWLVKLEYGFVVGFVLGLMNIVPYLGNIIGLSIVLPMAAIQGGAVELLLCLMVFTLVQILDGWVLTPRIMGNRTGLHPVTVIFSLFFWGVLLDGVYGLMLGIPLSAFITALWRLVRQEYLENIKNLV